MIKTDKGRMLNGYQAAAKEFAVYPKAMGVVYTALGLGNEAGEVQGKLKKYLRGDCNQVDMKEMVADELGDVLWYVAMLAHELGVPLETIATRNIEKLQDRKNRNVIRGNGDKR